MRGALMCCIWSARDRVVATVSRAAVTACRNGLLRSVHPSAKSVPAIAGNCDCEIRVRRDAEHHRGRRAPGNRDADRGTQISEPLDPGLTGLAQDYDVVVVSGRTCGSLLACVNDSSSAEIFGGLHQTKPDWGGFRERAVRPEYLVSDITRQIDGLSTELNGTREC